MTYIYKYVGGGGKSETEREKERKKERKSRIQRMKWIRNERKKLKINSQYKNAIIDYYR